VLEVLDDRLDDVGAVAEGVVIGRDGDGVDVALEALDRLGDLGAGAVGGVLGAGYEYGLPSLVAATDASPQAMAPLPTMATRSFTTRSLQLD